MKHSALITALLAAAALTAAPAYGKAHYLLAQGLRDLGRPAEAGIRLKEAKKLDPEISNESLLQLSPYSRDSDLAHHKEAYAKAGLLPATVPS